MLVYVILPMDLLWPLIIMIIFASFPHWDCIVRVPTRIFLYLYLTDSVWRTSIKGRAFQTQSPRGCFCWLLKLSSFSELASSKATP